MLRRNLIPIYCALLAVVLLPIGLFFVTQPYQANLQIGLALQLALGAVVGLFIPSLMLTWLMIGLTAIGTAVLIFGYVMIPIPAKLMLLAAFPTMASLAAVIRGDLLQYRRLAATQEEIERYLQHRDPVVTLRTMELAQTVYEQSRNLLREGVFLRSLDVTIIHWEHHQQYEQFHLEEHDAFLRALAHELRQHRLPAEQLFYIDDATFLIYSYDLSRQQIEQLTQTTRRQMAALAPVHPTGLKIGQIHLEQAEAARYDFHRLLHHLVRELETDIVVEYLLEAEQ